MVAAPVALASAGPADLEELLVMLERFDESQGYPFDPAQARYALGELLARPELGAVFRIVRGSESVGYVALTFGWSLEWGGRDAFVDEIFVEAPERGRGSGRMALRAIVDEARRLGVRALHLEVEDENETAKRLYRAEGFQATARRILTHRLSR
ncbi:MAG: GNAT family N-acetyltransferase [Myxococcota bacterium]